MVRGSTRTMAFSSGRTNAVDFVEIVDDDPSFEPVDHAVAEADGDDGCPDGSGRAGQLGGHGGKRALDPLGGNGDVYGSVVVHIDQHGPGGALANGGEDQGKRRNRISLVHQVRIGGEGQVPDARSVGPTLERCRRIGTVTGDQHIEAMVSELDGHHFRCCHTGCV